MLWAVVFALLVLWMVGLLLSDQDVLVHVPLAAALVLVAIQRVRERRKA